MYLIGRLNSNMKKKAFTNRYKANRIQQIEKIQKIKFVFCLSMFIAKGNKIGKISIVNCLSIRKPARHISVEQKYPIPFKMITPEKIQNDLGMKEIFLSEKSISIVNTDRKIINVEKKLSNGKAAPKRAINIVLTF